MTLLILATLGLGAVAFWQRNERKRKAALIFRENNRLTMNARPDEREQLRQLEAAYRLRYKGLETLDDRAA